MYPLFLLLSTSCIDTRSNSTCPRKGWGAQPGQVWFHVVDVKDHMADLGKKYQHVMLGARASRHPRSPCWKFLFQLVGHFPPRLAPISPDLDNAMQEHLVDPLGYGFLMSIIIYYHLLSSIIIYYHLLSSIIIYYHLLSSIIIYYHLLSMIKFPIPRRLKAFQYLPRTRPLAPGALLLAPGHVHLGLNLQAPSVGATKLLGTWKRKGNPTRMEAWGFKKQHHLISTGNV